MIIITYRVDSGAITAEQCQKKDARGREISTRLNQNMASFDGLNQGLWWRSLLIKNLVSRRCRGYRWRYIWCKTVYRPRQWLANNLSADGVAR